MEEWQERAAALETLGVLLSMIMELICKFKFIYIFINILINPRWVLVGSVSTGLKAGYALSYEVAQFINWYTDSLVGGKFCSA